MPITTWARLVDQRKKWVLSFSHAWMMQKIASSTGDKWSGSLRAYVPYSNQMLGPNKLELPMNAGSIDYLLLVLKLRYFFCSKYAS